jgi:hypothetical protein
MVCQSSNFYPLGTGTKCPIGSVEDWNLNELSIRKAIKCRDLKLISNIFSITLHDGYILWYTPKGQPLTSHNTSLGSIIGQK